MTYLQFPFDATCTITISDDHTIKTVQCELATSPVEIFQSLCFRKSDDFIIPLVLKFSEVNVQSFVLSRYNFLVEQIPVDKDGKVAGFSVVPAAVSQGSYIQAFSSFLFLIQAPVGFSKNYNLNENSFIRF